MLRHRAQERAPGVLLLLGNDVSLVAQVWLVREKVEREAASLFERLAHGLSSLGERESIVEIARQAARDEIDHAGLCRVIVDRHAPTLAPVQPSYITLGPLTLSPRQRTIYEAVALGCVTETLSAALLLEIVRVATDDLVAQTAHRILRDEVSHGRLGWAVLASEHTRRSTAWLAPHIEPMVRAALEDDLVPFLGETKPDERLDGYGVLSHARVRALAAETVRDVIEPGLVEFGVYSG